MRGKAPKQDQREWFQVTLTPMIALLHAILALVIP